MDNSVSSDAATDDIISPRDNSKFNKTRVFEDLVLPDEHAKKDNTILIGSTVINTTLTCLRPYHFALCGCISPGSGPLVFCLHRRGWRFPWRRGPRLL